MTTTAQRLNEAENALHQLNIGKAVVEVVDQNGERVRFTVANSSRLSAYIKQLKAELAGNRDVNRPMQFWGRG